jgi:hypothetical protein
MDDQWKLKLIYEESKELLDLFENNLNLMERNIQMLQALRETIDEYLLKFKEISLHNIEFIKE